MKIAICGANGMLGSDLIISSQERGYETIGLGKNILDITSLSDVQKKMRDIYPDFIINAAAYTDVDGCEAKYDLAYNVNGTGAYNLAVVAEELHVPLVHISTDYVFNGKGSEPYKEYDRVDPQSVYGKTKLDGEMFVRAHCSRHIIIRTSWLFGENGKNFVNTMLNIAKKIESVSVVNDQVGSPTYTKDLTEAILQLTRRPVYGTYHITNSGNCSWYDFAREIFHLAGITHMQVNPITSEHLNRTALRPKYSVLDNRRWRIEGYKTLRSYKDALTDYLLSLSKERKVG